MSASSLAKGRFALKHVFEAPIIRCLFGAKSIVVVVVCCVLNVTWVRGQDKQVHESQPSASQDKAESVPASNSDALKRLEAQLKRAINDAERRENQLRRREDLEHEIGALRQKLRDDSSIPTDELDALRLRLKFLQEDLEALRLPAFAASLPKSPMPRPLNKITIEGLSESAEKNLMARLPIRESDAVSYEMVFETIMSVRNFDEHLKVQFITTNDDQMELRIGLPSR